MEKKKNNNKVYIINVNSIIYLIVFLLILISTIYFISKGMGDTNVTIQSTGEYNQDQIIAIEAVANNVTGRINNIIAVSAIFFAVIVSSVSVFQFVKVKDFDKQINDLLEGTQLLNRDLTLSKAQIEELRYEINSIYDEKNILKLDNIRIKLEFNIYKIEDSFLKPGVNTIKFINLIDESINLTEKYPDIIDNIEVSKLYYKRAYSSYIINMKNDAIYYGNLALKKVKNVYPDMEVDNLSEMEYIENIGRLLINIYLEDNSNELIDNVINEIKNVLNSQLNDRLSFLYLSSVEEAIEIIEENYKYYGDYFLKKFNEYYNKGSFDNFKNDNAFIKLIESFNVRINE
ncbi:hypothetical protein H9660_08775 [Clostridium sp. Sa3CUN1]|uniref:Uncharacterized protein n=1 Tax=Clostridium gallinarum TaxID=2762246 RepID=A0ABR8Q4B8_9CLOT|nr:hypothetical protein [Clostridium gallinarum]MBD7915239.1 hypothetical protein [Clostridium gallinarum]